MVRVGLLRFHTFEHNFYASADVLEEGGKIKIIMEVPGIKEDDIVIYICEKYVSIEFEKKPDFPEESTVIVNERHFGKFKRIFLLPKKCTIEKSDMNIRNGLLNLEISISE